MIVLDRENFSDRIAFFHSKILIILTFISFFRGHHIDEAPSADQVANDANTHLNAKIVVPSSKVEMNANGGTSSEKNPATQ